MMRRRNLSGHLYLYSQSNPLPLSVEAVVVASSASCSLTDTVRVRGQAVNIATDCRPGRTLIDPCCGSGTILYG